MNSELSEETEFRSITITVQENSTREQVLEEFEKAKTQLVEHRRQDILWNAASIISAYREDLACEHTSEPTLDMVKSRLEQLPPKAIQERIKKLENELKDYENFEHLLELKLRKQIPANWRYIWGTEKEAIAELKDRAKKDIETIQAAIPHLEEILQLHKDVLSEKQAFIKAHASEVPVLIRECIELTKRALTMKEKVDGLIIKLEKSTLKERDKAKVAEQIIELICRHRQLEIQFDPKTNLLNEYQPEPGAEWHDKVVGFPSSRYNLPQWLQIKLEQNQP